MTAVFPNWSASKGGVKPGRFYACWHADGLRYGFSIEHQHSGIRLLLLHNSKQAEEAKTTPARGPALELQDAVITFEPDNVQFGIAYDIPVGSLILGDKRSLILTPKNGVVVDLETGGIAPMEEDSHVFYLERWKLLSAPPNQQPQLIFEFVGAVSSG